MNYDPEDYRTTWSTSASPLVLWAVAFLALVAMGQRDPAPPSPPMLLASPCKPLDPGALIPPPLPDPNPRRTQEVHAS